MAVNNGQIEFATWLLENNHAKADEKNKYGDTAFLLATQHDQIEFATWLIADNWIKKDELSDVFTLILSLMSSSVETHVYSKLMKATF